LHIEQVRIDGNTVKAETHCEFLAGHRRLAIDFAAPTFANPQDVRVNYRLDGHDDDWIDAGDDRVAYYTDLRPGAYTFRVTSRSGDGDWLEDEQTLAFAVKPRWWETAWFRASTALGLIGLAICSTWGYTRRIRQRNAVLRNEIHERKRVEEKARDYLRQLARINRAASMGEMGTSIAHEVNQPLFAIVSNAQTAKRLLDRQEPDIDEVRDALSDIVDDGNRAASIIKHIRSLVRNEQQPTEKLDLNQVALEALEFAGPEMRVRGLSLKSDLAGQLPPVEGNSIELQQVILNLIVNGAQAMAEIGDGPRELWLTTCTQDGFVELSVKDNGTGFDQKTMDRLFEPFFTTKPQGTGMGLAINRTIIEAHGGRIWATSNDELGATFHVRLPAVTGAVK
jgi:signal transduction histidine kinase